MREGRVHQQEARQLHERALGSQGKRNTGQSNANLKGFKEGNILIP